MLVLHSVIDCCGLNRYFLDVTLQEVHHQLLQQQCVSSFTEAEDSSDVSFVSLVLSGLEIEGAQDVTASVDSKHILTIIAHEDMNCSVQSVV
jgi:putative heme iron utilization protein